MLPIKNLDTRQQTYESTSNTDFTIGLPAYITLPSNTTFFYITPVTIPVSFCTIEERRNKKTCFY